MTPSQYRRVHAAKRPAAAAVALALVAGWFVSPAAGGYAGAASAKKSFKRVCAPAPRGYAACHEIVQTSPAPGPLRPNVTPAGYGPAQLQDAYDLPSGTAGFGRVVAIVDAFDLPTAEADLGTYRTQFGLPPCTSANGCFLKVNQRGDQTPLPASDSGWGREIALDLDMVSASCPNCAIVLVEADSAGLGDLATGAVTGGQFAEAVSNSYGAAESGLTQNIETSLDAFYSIPGVVYTVSSGDSGYGTQYPAASPNVVAVGGTSLLQDADPANTRGWSETVWFDPDVTAGPGSGCSAFEAMPAWQNDGGCSKRTEVDVAAVADPNTGVATYDSAFGWGVAGGTSASAPLIAGAYMLAGGPPVQKAARLPWNRGGAHLNDVTVGANSASCTDGYLCQAGADYDGPTGWGTPAGVNGLRSIAGVAEFDALGNTEFSVYRPSTHRWYVRGSGFYPVTWGTTGDIPVPADYFGDSFTDAAVYRPSTHRWYVQFLSGTAPVWGASGDIPVPADYDGDGVADFTTYRPSNHTWYMRNVGALAWGASGDTPVPATTTATAPPTTPSTGRLRTLGTCTTADPRSSMARPATFRYPATTTATARPTSRSSVRRRTSGGSTGTARSHGVGPTTPPSPATTTATARPTSRPGGRRTARGTSRTSLLCRLA